jgi:hypothetical protein
MVTAALVAGMAGNGQPTGQEIIRLIHAIAEVFDHSTDQETPPPAEPDERPAPSAGEGKAQPQ